ncbi:MAG: putative glycosidase [Acidimicrobiaceae bacterium]|nr:MAG: putative glycosidase [Acidimicrobiaceae bacterium]
MDLSGVWRASGADDEVRRTALGLHYDDGSWPTVSVPGHWRHEPPFATTDGPLLYRTRFQLDPPPPGRRAFVTLHGVFYQADVWLDGAYLGDPEGYFFPHSFDITDLTRLTPDHILAVEVVSAPQRDPRKRRNLTGAYQDDGSVDGAWNPGGLWRHVTVDLTGPARIDRCRVLCRDANDTRAHLRLHARLDSDAARSVTVTTLVDDTVMAEQDHSLAKGMNDIAWTLDVAKPALWWPWSLGDQPLHEVRVVLAVDGVASHEHAVRTGLREISVDDWIVSVNGERLFAKGINMPPAHIDLATSDATAIAHDVALAREAGLDLIRAKGHIAPPDFYAAADRIGMLVWQDFPLHGRFVRAVRRQAVEQARAAVDVLGHHPSIMLWCAHDTPEVGAVSQQLPTWNKTILDRWVKRAIEKIDESRPVIANSGVAPHLPQLEGTDTHLRFGWGRGEARDLAGFAALLPRMVGFASEFGSQSVPDSHEFIATEAWPELPWDELVAHGGLQRELMAQYVPVTGHTTFESWKQATQRYQSDLLRHHIETLRRLKYRPTGGFCLSSLADPSPRISSSILDHERRPKLAFAAVTDACRPVIVVADRLADRVAVGAGIALDIHVVSDAHHTLEHAECTAALRWPGGRHTWRFTGDIPPDDCVRVGTIQFVVPDAPGGLWLDLTLDHGEGLATNRYESLIGR